MQRFFTNICKAWLLWIMASGLTYASSPPPVVERANEALAKANLLYLGHQYVQAGLTDLEVLKTPGLSDDMYSSAYLLMGNINLSMGDTRIAGIAYKKVLNLKNAPPADKKYALDGINLIQLLNNSPALTTRPL